MTPSLLEVLPQACWPPVSAQRTLVQEQEALELGRPPREAEEAPQELPAGILQAPARSQVLGRGTSLTQACARSVDQPQHLCQQGHAVEQHETHRCQAGRHVAMFRCFQ